LNENKPGDPRDTTTPLAMLEILRKTALGDALAAPSLPRAADGVAPRLQDGEQKAAGRRAEAWRVGDKTGTGDNNATNDIAVIWPTGRAPIIDGPTTEARASDDERNAVLAEVGRLASRYRP
jgi:beta-lactamase class A